MRRRRPDDSGRKPTRALFLTRKFPPSIGGMETLAAGIWRTLSAAAPDSVLVAHRGRNPMLPLWLPRALARTLRLAATGRVDLVLAGDGPMCAVVSPFLRLVGVPCVTMALGLDLTYENRLYRSFVFPAVRRARAVIAISEATAAVAREVGVDPAKLHVVRLGVDAPEVTLEQRRSARDRLNERLSTTDEQVLVLALGRLVRRKGMEWFVRNVLPSLPPRVVLVVAGDGREAERVHAAIEELDLSDRVRLLGVVDDAEREGLFQGADLFVQPNVPVRGDIEGFGLVTIEAAMRGLPVVASDLEGIAEAVVDGVTGMLLPPADSRAWIETLTELTAEKSSLAASGAAFQEAARQRYSERAMGDELVAILGLERQPS